MAMPVNPHFLHPQHELKLRTKYHLPHYCDLCGEKVTGSGYSCHWRLCDFNLHEECVQYPETLSFFAHPWHDLTLARTDDNNDGRRRVACDLCREDVPAGVFVYRCVPCGFAVHRRCSRLPHTVRSDLHLDHGLTALPGLGACAACGEFCGVWAYRCGLCNFDLHIQCLHGARPSTTAVAVAAATAIGGSGSSSSSRREESPPGNKFWGGVAEAAVEGVAEAAAEDLLQAPYSEEPQPEENDYENVEELGDDCEGDEPEYDNEGDDYDE